MFLQAEPYLTMSDFVAVEKNYKNIAEKYAQLEIKLQNIMKYLESNSIQIPQISN
jgi:hypothetical protein